MKFEIFRHIALFCVLALVQVLVLNHIQIAGVATPLLYVYFIEIFRRNYSRHALVCWGFALGLLMDTFQNTPGAAAASLTLLAFLQPELLDLFLTREQADDMSPSKANLGRLPFFYFTTLCTSLFCIVFFLLESFSFFNWVSWLERSLGSIALTEVLIMAIDTLRKKKERKE